MNFRRSLTFKKGWNMSISAISVLYSAVLTLEGNQLSEAN